MLVVGGGGEVEAVVFMLLEGRFVGVEGIDEEVDVASAQVVVFIGLFIVALLIAIIAIIAVVVSCVSVYVITIIPVAIIPVPVIAVVVVIADIVPVPVISVVISIAVNPIFFLILVEGLKVLFVNFVRVLALVGPIPLGLNIVLAHGFQRGHVFGVIEVVDVVAFQR